MTVEIGFYGRHAERDHLRMEEVTRSTIEEFINSIEDEERRLKLQRLQFRIDRELRNYKDPVARMNKMVELFWEGFKEFDEVLQHFKGE
jgi:hypothetical protein